MSAGITDWKRRGVVKMMEEELEKESKSIRRKEEWRMEGLRERELRGGEEGC